MIECETTTRRWGNSLGIAIPREVVLREHLKEDQQLKILIVKQGRVLKQSFGLLKGKLTKSGQQLKDELRRELHHG